MDIRLSIGWVGGRKCGLNLNCDDLTCCLRMTSRGKVLNVTHMYMQESHIVALFSVLCVCGSDLKPCVDSPSLPYWDLNQ